jgi:putative ABC transport system ATP-binding protein
MPTPTPWQRFRRLLTMERGDVIVVAAYSLGIGLLSLAVPVATQALVNTVGFTALMQPVVVLSLLVLLGLVLAGALRTLQSIVVEVLQQRLFVRAAHDLASRLPFAATVPPTSAQATGRSASAGVSNSRMVNRFFDVVILQKTAASLLLEGLSVLLQGTVGLMLLAFYHPWLLAFDAFLLIAIVTIVFGFGRKGPATAIYESKTKHEVVDWLQTIADHPSVFKVPGASQFAFLETDKRTRKHIEARKKHFKVLLRQVVLSHGLQALAVASLLGLGGALVIAGQLSVGQWVAAELIVGSVVAGLTKLGKHLESYYDLVAALDKMSSLVELPLERSSGIERMVDREHSGARLELEDVAVGFSESGPLLKNVNFSLAAGESVAVLGRNCTGKSALADVLSGDFAPRAGLVRLNGIEVRSLAKDTLRREVVVVRHDDTIAGTVFDNVALGRPGIGPEAVLAALETVGLAREVTGWPGGVESHIGRGGVGLSSGKRTRLALARALVGTPQLLVIDDVLDTMDPGERTLVMQALNAQLGHCSLLILTRDEAVSSQCQRTVTIGFAPALNLAEESQ